MSRTTEKMLQERVDGLAERYPEADLRLQWRGVGWGVWSAKHGKWLIEGMATNSDLADAISGTWEIAMLERHQVRRDMLAKLREMTEKVNLFTHDHDSEESYDYLASELAAFVREQAQLLP